MQKQLIHRTTVIFRDLADGTSSLELFYHLLKSFNYDVYWTSKIETYRDGIDVIYDIYEEAVDGEETS